MHNTYFSSTMYAIRCKESFSLSFNGYSNSWYERFDRTSSHCSSRCGCCDCCALSTYKVPIKLSLLNGLRQSTLLQMSASRRFILGVGDQYFSRLPAYGLHRGCYNLDCSVKERNVCNRSRRRIKERCFSAGLQKERERYHSFGSDDAEAVLSLLSEEADEDFIGIQWKNASSYKGREAEKKGKNISGDENLSLCKKVGIEKKGNLKHHETFTIEMKREDENSNEEKEAFKKCENGNFENHETFTIDLKRENEKSKKEREAFTKSENHKKRRDVSSCSSYYSLSSSGDFGSGQEVQGKHGVEELSVGYEKDEANHLEGQLKEEFNRQIDGSEKLQDVSNRERTAFGADTDWNLRKKSEKKLSELTIEETESTKEVQDMHPRAFRTHESSYEKASISHKQLNSEEDNSSFAKDLGKEAKKAYFQTVNRSRHQSTDIQEYGGDEIETALTSRKTFSGREGNLEMSEKMLKETSNEHKKIVGSTSTKGKDVANRNSQKYIGYPKIQDTERYSNTTMRNLGPSKVSVLSTVRGLEEQQHQKDEKIIIQTEERRKSRQFSEVSQVRESNVVDTSSVKSTAKIKSWEENLDISSDKRITQSIQPRKGSELVSTLSEGNASDQKQVSSSQRTSDKGRFIQRGKSTSIVKSGESSCQTDERITQFLLASEAQRPQNLSVSGETNSREESSFQGSLSLVSEARKHVLLAEGNERSSAIIMIPSLSQLIGGGSAHVELTAGIASPEIFPGTSERSSSLYENPGRSSALLSESYSTVGSDQAYSEPSNIMVPEDALGSADRLEKASKQFVDEFVEKIRHEVTSLETQEIEATGTKLASEDAGNQICSSMQHGTQNRSQLKDRDSSRSSGFPGTKGPSDEMWDVTEPSVKQSSMAEEPKISKVAGKPIVNRTGRSLWSMIADVVRLRWGSRAGSSTSAGRSGERNSSNKSDSETWFSGPEHEETSRSNVINERTSVQLQAMTSDKLKPEKHDTRSEGDVSDIKTLKDKGKQLEVGSSSPNTLESGSTSVGASYASGEENASWTEDGKDLKVSTLGIEKLELPVTLPARGPPIVEELVNIGRSDMLSVTESVMPMEEPVAPTQTELSSRGRKDGELKQRKFQRNRQVLRDRFDEWEEAYKHELEQRRMDETFMMEAILEAKKAADTWEVPVGAVLVQHGKIIARGYNLVEELRDSTAHAEMICIREASNLLRTWRLSETTLYVTLEPCPMCAGAILQARIDTVVWGAPNKLLGADGSWIRLFPDGGENISEPNDKPPAPVHPFHPKMNIRRGVLATECADVMQQFFQLRRKKNKEPPRDPSGDPSRPPVVHNPSKFLSKMQNIFHFMFCW